MTSQYLTQEEKKKRKLRSIRLWTGSVLVVALSVWGVVALQKASEGSVLGTSVSQGDHIFGNAEAKVELVEYSDLQCPACANAGPSVKRILEEYGSQVKFVYRHFPLSQHKNAVPAAEAAEAVGVQGKFLEMANVLFERQNAWKDSFDPSGTFVGYASELGLDADKFQRDMRSEDIQAKIQNDYQSGVEAGVNSTPTFFLNGKKIVTPPAYDGYKNLIDQALDETK